MKQPERSAEQARRRLTLLLVALINGLVLYGGLAVLFGRRLTGGRQLLDLPAPLVLGLLGVCLVGTAVGLVAGRSGQDRLRGSTQQIAARVGNRRILGAALIEGFGFIAIMLGFLTDAFPMALVPAAAAVAMLFMLRPGVEEWRRLMRAADS